MKKEKGPFFKGSDVFALKIKGFMYTCVWICTGIQNSDLDPDLDPATARIRIQYRMYLDPKT